MLQLSLRVRIIQIAHLLASHRSKVLFQVQAAQEELLHFPQQHLTQLIDFRILLGVAVVGAFTAANRKRIL